MKTKKINLRRSLELNKMEKQFIKTVKEKFGEDQTIQGLQELLKKSEYHNGELRSEVDELRHLLKRSKGQVVTKNDVNNLLRKQKEELKKKNNLKEKEIQTLKMDLEKCREAKGEKTALTTALSKKLDLANKKNKHYVNHLKRFVSDQELKEIDDLFEDALLFDSYWKIKKKTVINQIA